MYSIGEAIKKCALEAVYADKPVEVVFALVTREEDIVKKIPLEITIEQKLVIKRDFLLNTDNTYGLKLNERLILLRLQGGQMYYLLDIIREEEPYVT